MKLKSLFLISVSLIMLSGCGPTKEEKAQEMAANYLKGVLYHFDSYEPLQTKVDSSFVSLTTDKEAIDLTLNMLQLFQSVQKYDEKIIQAETSMDIWAPNGYSSAYSNGKYNRAKEERDNNQMLLDKTKDKVVNLFSKIKDRQANLKEGNFNGWKVYHKFKCLNGSGTVDLLGEYVFYCDTDFNELFVYSKEDYEAIVKVIQAISSSEDISVMVEKIQEEIL